ncbi:predicted protein, partial [Phaeodactylum tricornutum CCAP 1055/1]
MIVYEQDLFGLKNLTRVHGSAVYRVVLPASVSSAILLIFHSLQIDNDQTQKAREDLIVQHPYVIGAFVGFFSFLLTFRLNFAYQRYWEGATAIHQMLSKWTDFGMNVAAFHYQSDVYDDIQPPSFGSHPNLRAKDIVGRERDFETTYEECVEKVELCLEEMQQESIANTSPAWWRGGLRRRRHKDHADSTRQPSTTTPHRLKSINANKETSSNSAPNRLDSYIPIPQRFQEQFGINLRRQSTPITTDSRANSRRSSLVKQSKASQNLVSRKARVPLPSLFLQETAHLLSLLAGVAFSTLRNDMEQAENPLNMYYPGKPWPAMDPDCLDKDTKHLYGEDQILWQSLYFMLGLDRSERHRTLYNAARPFGVLGGVSDQEIAMLQQAHGPYAKVALCTMWTQEFISREYMVGSAGKVAPPIVSRLYQFLSDGVVGYNQARKVAYIPYPFVNAQMTAFFSLSIIFIFPMLMYSYVNVLWFACVLNFTVVTCFLGMHEVARELENPMQNAPNDLPLVTYQAQFNEALVTMYAGFHPDSWWEIRSQESKDDNTQF